METKASGKDIILAILDNMRQSGEPLLYRTLLPSHFDVYLHREDYSRLSSVFNIIRDECVKALDQELTGLNKQGFSLLSALKPKPPKYETAQRGWSIKYYIDENNELSPGDIMVDSRIALPATAEYSVGTKTQRAETISSGGETRMLRKFQEGEKKENPPAHARLAYKDKEGRAREYLMTSAEISIGRGGHSEFCDLELDGPTDISRQHLYLRLDSETREFFIQDVSRFGTSVNGEKLKHKEWIRLQTKSIIVLANAMEIEFEQL